MRTHSPLPPVTGPLASTDEPPLLIPVRPGLGPISGSGTTWSYFYDRNAIAGSELVGDYLVAITVAGNVLVFDARTFELTSEAVAPEGATCIGAARSGVLVGFSNGSIARFAIPNLGVEERSRHSGTPIWVGERRTTNGAIVVYADADDDKGIGPKITTFRVRDLSSGRETAIPPNPARPDARWVTFALDRSDQLWMASKSSAYPARVETVDLNSGEISQQAIPPVTDVLGLEVDPDTARNGVLAYGGGVHGFSGGCRAFVDRIAPEGLDESYSNRTPDPDERATLPRGHARVGRAPSATPTCRIHFVAPVGQELLAFSNETADPTSSTIVWRWDRTLAKWTRLISLDIADPISNSPIKAVHISADHSIIATSNGYLELRGDVAFWHSLPGQLPVDASLVRGSSHGIFVQDPSENWSFLQSDKWLPIESKLPAEVQRATSRLPWCVSRIYVLSGPADAQYVVAPWSSQNFVAEDRCPSWEGVFVARLAEDGRIERLGEQRGYWSTPFVLPDGRLAMARLQPLSPGQPLKHGPGIQKATGKPAEPLWVFDSSAFRDTRPPSWPAAYDVPYAPITKVLGNSGDFSLALSYSRLGEFRIVNGVPQFQIFSPGSNDDAPSIYDATRTPQEQVLLATERGVYTYRPDTKSLQELAPEGLYGTVRCIASDRAGVIWLGGRGLFRMSSLDRATRIRSNLPPLSDATVTSLTTVESRMIVALGRRGLVFLDPQTFAASTTEAETKFPPKNVPAVPP